VAYSGNLGWPGEEERLEEAAYAGIDSITYVCNFHGLRTLIVILG
jgi:hypothetical protein